MYLTIFHSKVVEVHGIDIADMFNEKITYEKDFTCNILRLYFFFRWFTVLSWLFTFQEIWDKMVLFIG